MSKPKSKRTLCIIDMQPEFEASRNANVIQSVCREARKAVRYGWDVIMVEYDCGGYTHLPIRKALMGYKNVHKVIKCHDDGSLDIMMAAARNHISLKKVRFCGVNSSACVDETVTGILREMGKNVNVELVSDGCNCPENDPKCTMIDLKRIKGKKRNVKIV